MKPANRTLAARGSGGDDAYILALDSGTTSVRSILFDAQGRPIAQAQRPIEQHYPQPGWVEHDPREILAKQVATISEVQYASGIHSDRIAAVGITNQRETTVVWDRVTGEPVYNAICWQCRRTEPMISRLEADGYAVSIRAKTGLVADPYFSASKIAWILENVPGARERARAGDLLFGTVDSWLIWNLTDRAVHATDRTNASRTMLYNIHTLEWDAELLDLFGIPVSMMPHVQPSCSSFSLMSKDVMRCRPPIAGVAGDQQASLFGHRCFSPGSVKATYGTGCFILMNTGGTAVDSRNGLLTTIAATSDGSVEYALEGSVFNAGSVVQWLRDEMGLVKTTEETEELALSVKDAAGVHLVPAFTGLGAPWWDANARAMISGLTRGSTRAHVVRAALEGIAFQVYDVVQAMQRDAGCSVERLAVDGGGSRNRFTMQWQADLLRCSVERPIVTETTALGAAFLAGLQVGFWPNVAHLDCLQQVDYRFEPSLDERRRVQELDNWHRALGRCSDAVGRA